MNGSGRLRHLAAGGTLALVLVLASCGGETTPADVPEVSAALQQVDEAVVDRDYAAARDAVDELEAVTEQALEDGNIDDVGAQRILDAASALTDSLEGMSVPDDGEATPDAPITETPEPDVEAPEPDPPPDDEAEDDDDDKGDKGEDKGKGKGKGGKP